MVFLEKELHLVCCRLHFCFLSTQLTLRDHIPVRHVAYTSFVFLMQTNDLFTVFFFFYIITQLLLRAATWVVAVVI